MSRGLWSGEISFRGGEHKMPKWCSLSAAPSRTQINQPARVCLLFKMSPPAAMHTHRLTHTVYSHTGGGDIMNTCIIDCNSMWQLCSTVLLWSLVPSEYVRTFYLHLQYIFWAVRWGFGGIMCHLPSCTFNFCSCLCGKDARMWKWRLFWIWIAFLKTPSWHTQRYRGQRKGNYGIHMIVSTVEVPFTAIKVLQLCQNCEGKQNDYRYTHKGAREQTHKI